MSDKVHYRTIIPLFFFKLEPSDETISLKQTYNTYDFEVMLKKYEHGIDSFNELMRYTDEQSKKELVSIHMDEQSGYGSTDYFLTCDIDLPFDEYENHAYPLIVCEINKIIIKALNLNSSLGIYYWNIYIFKYPLTPSSSALIFNEQIKLGRYITCTPHFRKNIFNHLGLDYTILDTKDKKNFEKFINFFCIIDLNVETQLNRLLKLTLDYFGTVHQNESIEISFLSLMIIFDSLLKTEDENSGKAIKRVKGLLTSNRNEKKEIHNDFSADKSEGFYKIRNHIAHGNPLTNKDLVKNKFPILYKYTLEVFKKIILENYDLLNDVNIDYYNGLDKLVRKKQIKSKV